MQLKNKNWHQLSLAEVFQALDSSKKGLLTATAKQQFAKYGPNELPTPKPPSDLKRFLQQFNNILIYILMGASFITAWMDDWLDTGVIWAVVLLNALIGFVQEGKAASALNSLKNMLSLEATVLRDGKKQRLPASELVPGDVVAFKAGDKIPADMRLVEAHSLKVEEAALTGESVAASKELGDLPLATILADRTNMVYAGCSVAYGGGVGVIVGTGLNTEIGHINTLLDDVTQLTTPLLEQIDKFGKILSVAILLVAGVVFGIGYLAGMDLENLFLSVIGLVVAAIPEGLPALMTITLALGVQKMAAKNAIIRKLPSVETLGAVGVICSDKTGTLTKNEMTVSELVTGAGTFQVSGAGYAPEGTFSHENETIQPDEHPILRQLLGVFFNCNDASLSQEQGVWKLTGQPTEGALMAVARKAGSNQQAPRLATFPFDSNHKFMAVMVAGNGNTNRVLVKGAPEQLLARSATQLNAGDTPTPLELGQWEKHITDLAAKGNRVIAAAYLEVPKNQQTITAKDLQALIFLGLAGLIDPPREEVFAAISACQSAGIRVKMITGDHALTAETIGNQLGIAKGQQALTGQAIEKMSDTELAAAAQNHHIFARTTPEHKLRLVNALQAAGAVVAMTGDGVNDAPALKRADIGIAMGIKGTEVTKDAADMVLADDNFSSIAQAVRQGRTTYANLKKAILFILPTNVAEGLVILIALALGTLLPMPITPVQILWVNMVTAVTLGLALAFEPAEPEVMQQPPRSRSTAILDGYLTWRVFFVSVLMGLGVLFLFWNHHNTGADVALSRTVAVNALVVAEAFYLLNCRYIHYPVLGKGFFGNPVVFIALGLLAVLQGAFTYWPVFNNLFGTAPLSLAHWSWIFGMGAVVFALVELEKVTTNFFAKRHEGKAFSKPQKQQ